MTFHKIKIFVKNSLFNSIYFLPFILFCLCKNVTTAFAFENALCGKPRNEMENVTTKKSKSSVRNIRIVDIQSVADIEEEIVTHPLLDAQSKTQQKYYSLYEKHTTKKSEESENSLPEPSETLSDLPITKNYILNRNVRREVHPPTSVFTLKTIEEIFFKLVGFIVQVCNTSERYTMFQNVIYFLNCQMKQKILEQFIFTFLKNYSLIKNFQTKK